MKAYSIGTQQVFVRAESTDTNAICAVLEMHHPSDSGPPLHYHDKEDEGFYILEGTYRFRINNEIVQVGPGDFLMAARRVPHCFRSLGPETGKMLVYFTPGGAETYFERMSQIALDDPDRGVKCSELDQQFGITILGGGV